MVNWLLKTNYIVNVRRFHEKNCVRFDMGNGSCFKQEVRAIYLWRSSEWGCEVTGQGYSQYNVQKIFVDLRDHFINWIVIKIYSKDMKEGLQKIRLIFQILKIQNEERLLLLSAPFWWISIRKIMPYVAIRCTSSATFFSSWHKYFAKCESFRNFENCWRSRWSFANNFTSFVLLWRDLQSWELWFSMVSNFVSVTLSFGLIAMSYSKMINIVLQSALVCFNRRTYPARIVARRTL